MRISARADYAIRAALVLAKSADQPMKSEDIAKTQDIPIRYLEHILTDLRKAGIITSQRGARGGHLLAQPAHAISLADVIRAVDGPLVFVRHERPGDLAYTGVATALPDVWLALREAVRGVLENTSLDHVVSRRDQLLDANVG